MSSFLFRIYRLATALWLSAAIAGTLCAAAPQEDDVTTITRDVLIVGGGATGTFAGVRLQEMDKSVAIVERNDYLGGRTHTLRVDGTPIDYGVYALFNDPVTVNFLRRLGVETEFVGRPSFTCDWVDFTTGEPALTPDGLLSTTVAALLYRTAIQRFDSLQNGIFDLGDPIPEELLIPFREFVKRHAIQGALQLILMFTQNVGNILDAPTWLVIRDFGIPHVNALLSGFLATKNGVGGVYQKAAERLDPNVLYQTTVANVTRPDTGGVRAVVQDAHGKQTIIQAKKLLVTIPPTLTNLEPFDLDKRETGIFRQWLHNWYYAALVNDTGLPAEKNVANTNPHRLGGLPTTPFQWQLDYGGVPGYHTVKAIAEENFTEQDAKDLVVSDILRMGKAGTYETREANFVAIASHVPITLRPPEDALLARFYDGLYALQGHRDTFYTGLAFCSDYSSLLWAYTDTVLYQLLQ